MPMHSPNESFEGENMYFEEELETQQPVVAPAELTQSMLFNFRNFSTNLNLSEGQAEKIMQILDFIQKQGSEEFYIKKGKQPVMKDSYAQSDRTQTKDSLVQTEKAEIKELGIQTEAKKLVDRDQNTDLKVCKDTLVQTEIKVVTDSDSQTVGGVLVSKEVQTLAKEWKHFECQTEFEVVIQKAGSDGQIIECKEIGLQTDPPKMAKNTFGMSKPSSSASTAPSPGLKPASQGLKSSNAGMNSGFSSLNSSIYMPNNNSLNQSMYVTPAK